MGTPFVCVCVCYSIWLKYICFWSSFQNQANIFKFKITQIISSFNTVIIFGDKLVNFLCSQREYCVKPWVLFILHFAPETILINL